jgi:uncharacterized protein YcbX
MTITVAGLYCYPVKSCRGIPLRTAEVGAKGIRHDRQWMVVNEEGLLVSQIGVQRMAADVKSMCLIETAIDGDRLVLRAPGMPPLALPLEGVEGEAVEAKVWMDSCPSVDQGDEAAGWLTAFLSRERPGEYRLVRMPEGEARRAGPILWKSATPEVPTAFANQYPFLVISQASLDDLNGRLPAPVGVDRFRPNIVISGCEPYAEDHVAGFRVGLIEFRGRSQCVRCAVITADQATGERGKEPLKTLATYRKHDRGVVFGRNFDYMGSGTLTVGDRVEILERD